MLKDQHLTACQQISRLYGTRRLIVPTTEHYSEGDESSSHHHAMFLRNILILYSHLRLGQSITRTVYQLIDKCRAVTQREKFFTFMTFYPITRPYPEPVQSTEHPYKVSVQYEGVSKSFRIESIMK